jgi:GAF domain-containing protein
MKVLRELRGRDGTLHVIRDELDRLRSETAVNCTTFGLVDQESRTFAFWSDSISALADGDIPLPIPEGPSPSETALRTGRVCAEDGTGDLDDLCPFMLAEGYRAYLIAPVFTDPLKACGLICMLSRRARRWTTTDRSRISGAASRVGTALACHFGPPLRGTLH